MQCQSPIRTCRNGIFTSYSLAVLGCHQAVCIILSYYLLSRTDCLMYSVLYLKRYEILIRRCCWFGWAAGSSMSIQCQLSWLWPDCFTPGPEYSPNSVWVWLTVCNLLRGYKKINVGVHGVQHWEIKFYFIVFRYRKSSVIYDVYGKGYRMRCHLSTNRLASLRGLNEF